MTDERREFLEAKVRTQVHLLTAALNLHDAKKVANFFNSELEFYYEKEKKLIKSNKEMEELAKKTFDSGAKTFGHVQPFEFEVLTKNLAIMSCLHFSTSNLV